MKNENGFTLIELMIVIAIIGIAVSIFVQMTSDRTTCINGYVFARGYSTKYSVGNVAQILDDQGHGIKCEVK